MWRLPSHKVGGGGKLTTSSRRSSGKLLRRVEGDVRGVLFHVNKPQGTGRREPERVQCLLLLGFENKAVWV